MSFAIHFGTQNSHKREIAIFLIIVKAKSDNELIGDSHSAVIRNEFYRSPRGLVEQCGRTDAARPLLGEVLYKMRKCSSAVYDILNDYKIDV